MSTEELQFNTLGLTPGSLIAGRYEVWEPLGEGGIGIVFLVKDRQLDNQVLALKLLHPRFAANEEVFARFRNEVLVARTLSHPNIVRIHDFGQHEDFFHYISMEYVDGESLKQKIKRKAVADQPCGLVFDEAVSYLRQVLLGVSYAHGQGVIHRDIKPANVLITRSGKVKLADFGTARLIEGDTTLTQTGQIIGTPGYISPEQLEGGRGGLSSDIYALGIMAYELVAGQLPFHAESFVELAVKQMTEPIPRLSAKFPDIPPWYDEMVIKASLKDPSERLTSVQDLLTIIDAHAGSAITEEKPFVHKISPLTIIGSALALLLLFSLVWFFYPASIDSGSTDVSGDKSAIPDKLARAFDEELETALDAEIESREVLGRDDKRDEQEDLRALLKQELVVDSERIDRVERVAAEKAAAEKIAAQKAAAEKAAVEKAAAEKVAAERAAAEKAAAEKIAAEKAAAEKAAAEKAAAERIAAQKAAAEKAAVEKAAAEKVAAERAAAEKAAAEKIAAENAAAEKTAAKKVEARKKETTAYGSRGAVLDALARLEEEPEDYEEPVKPAIDKPLASQPQFDHSKFDRTEYFSGTMLSSDAGDKGREYPLTLNLGFQGERVEGFAVIVGVGRFTIQGKESPGKITKLKLKLTGSKHSVVLEGERKEFGPNKDKGLGGDYSFSGEDTKGSWRADLIRRNIATSPRLRDFE